MHSLDRKIINHLQGGFPLTENPWDHLSRQLDIPVDEIICRIGRMTSEGVLSRFGPIYNAEKMGGGLTLAATRVEPDRYEEVTEIINAFDEVAHNYARDHELNMWFVIATETPEGIQQVIDRIEAQTGLKVFNMPKQEEYFLELKFEV
ncbi:MAG: Lrp/AsnC family transcriptional regulator [Gammaproteobacteria bacterium]|nr:Lrp/AsnC family transcriptional regulator [Gammaproteobacteria bacterium]MDH5734819.1 Lrp/AsnC family transcriptional regulator [Gammaproteobacteria bacterium]